MCTKPTCFAITFVQSPYGSTQAAYYLEYLNGGEVRRIAFTGTANRSPTAEATATPASGPAPLSVTLDGSGSTDPDGDALSYTWSFGDGSANGSGAIVHHSYAAGTYTATLTVRDGHGGHDTATVRIDSGNTPPVPKITSPTASTTFGVG